MKQNPLLVWLMMMALAAATASAQDAPVEDPPPAPGIASPDGALTPLSIGLIGGYGIDLYYGSIDLAADPELGDDNCGVLESGTGRGVAAGIFAEYLLPSGIGVGARFLSAPISGSVVAPSGSTSAFRRKNGSLVEITSDNRMELEIPIYQLELYGSFEPFDMPIRVTGGPRIGIAGEPAYALREELVEPGDLVFRDGRRYRVISEGDPGTPLLFGLGATVRYQLRLSRTVDMMPELAIGTTVNSITKYGTMRAANARLGLGLRYTFPVPDTSQPPPPPLPPPVAVVDTTPAPPARLTARIAATGIDPSGAPRQNVLVSVRERVTAREVPLLPYLFFEESSATIPGRYMTPADRSGDALAIYGDLLRIVAERMAADPAERITLRGSTSGSPTERGMRALPLERARAVRQELVARWGIDSSRIAIEGRLLPANPSGGADSIGREENRRVEIVASEAVLAPVTLLDTARTIESPGIRFDSEIEAERGLESWLVEVMLAGRPIRRLRGNTAIRPSIDDQFTPNELAALASGQGPITYTLSARDNESKEIRSESGSIGIDVERSGGDLAVPSGSGEAPAAMILFDYNSSELDAAARATLKRLRSRLPSGATIRLVGFADETGEAEYNQKLSLARARAVSAALGTEVTEIVGAGESTLPYDNSRPEGRFYSRSVRIEVRREK